MSYQGLRVDRDNRLWVRYKVKGRIEEAGPYASAAEALRHNQGRATPPLTSANSGRNISQSARTDEHVKE